MMSRLMSLVVALSLVGTPAVVGACAAWLCAPTVADAHAGHEGQTGGAADAGTRTAVADPHAGHHDQHQHHGPATTPGTPPGDAAPRVVAVPQPSCCALAASVGTLVAAAGSRFDVGALASVAALAIVPAADVEVRVRAESARPPGGPSGPPAPATTVRVLRI